MKHPQLTVRVTLLAVCLSLVSLGTKCAFAAIPIPEASLLPTPDEVRRATIGGQPCFPMSVDDGNFPAKYKHLFPGTPVVQYPLTSGDQTAQRTTSADVLAHRLASRVLCNENSAQRVRKLVVAEFATPPNDRTTLFNQTLIMVLTRYADPAHVAAGFAERRRSDQSAGAVGDTLQIGDDAYLRNSAAPTGGELTDVFLEIQQGAFHILVAIDSPSPYYEAKLRALVVRLGEMIVAKVKPVSGGGTPPVVTAPARLEITAGPSGNPNPVAPGGRVQCVVQARHEKGLALSYRWTANSGSFSDSYAQNPVWTAPATGGASECCLTVCVTAPDGAQIGASFPQSVGSAPAVTLPSALRVFIDGRLMFTRTPPTEVNGRVLVGVADIFRELGASVVWDGAQRKTTATRGARVVEFWIGRTMALVDGVAVALDVAPVVLGRGSTYVPVRFVSLALGAGVSYDPVQRAVLITTASMPPGGVPTALTVTTPVNNATVPERFAVAGTGLPGQRVRVTVVAEGTLKATGQNATSRLLDNAEAKVGLDGRWSIEVNSYAVRHDSRVALKQFSISVQMAVDGRAVDRVMLVARP